MEVVRGVNLCPAVLCLSRFHHTLSSLILATQNNIPSLKCIGLPISLFCSRNRHYTFSRMKPSWKWVGMPTCVPPSSQSSDFVI